jgi:SSS family solute:Na+ symporter
VLVAMGMGTVGKDLFSLFQAIIGYVAPPIAAVFLMAVLWRRATGGAAFLTLAGGSALCLTVGALDFYNKPLLVKGFNAVLPLKLAEPPHFLYLSFGLFVLCLAAMFVISLVTRAGPGEESLPSLGAAYKKTGARMRGLLAGWAILAMIMAGLYAGFESLSSRPAASVASTISGQAHAIGTTSSR